MRVAILHPNLDLDQSRNFNGFDFAFFKLFKPIVYITHWREFLRYRTIFKQHGWNPNDFDFALGTRHLNRKADVLVCFAGRPDLSQNAPLPGFRGMQIFHGMDYVFRASECNATFERAGVDYLMGYTDHGQYCPFFQRFYPKYRERVIPVPFGYGERFENKTPFSERTQKVIALGSVNPVDDPAVEDRSELHDYIEFYKDVRWTHQWRRLLAEHEGELSDIMDSQLPHFPETKNPSYDAVAMMNQYAMFANDEGLMAFPPARTYEGTAAGSVMVCSDHPSYTDLGFEDGVNCIMHPRHDIAQFREKVQFYRENPEQLAEISERSTAMVRSRYSHEQVARDLYQNIEAKWQHR